MNIHVSKSKFQFFLFFVLALLFAACEKDPFEASSGTFTDRRDGHEYKWVKIGEQIWMAENLAYAPYVCAPDSQCGIWVNDYYGKGPYVINYHTYGCLYDWKTACEVCPEGWHLPSDEEWIELERFLGMESDELYNTHWRGYSNRMYGKFGIGSNEWNFVSQYATNESGFTALPAGLRIYEEKSPSRFGNPGYVTYFWTSTVFDDFPAYVYERHFSDSGIFRHYKKKEYGFSVRCIKDK